MKSIKQKISTTLIITIFMTISISASAQQGPGAPPPPDHGTENNQGQGGRAPIGGGLLILLGLGGVYGGYKVCRKKVSHSDPIT